jgi:hypothetical protein
MTKCPYSETILELMRTCLELLVWLSMAVIDMTFNGFHCVLGSLHGLLLFLFFYTEFLSSVSLAIITQLQFFNLLFRNQFTHRQGIHFTLVIYISIFQLSLKTDFNKLI